MDTPTQIFTPPYPPSWIDRLLDWIERLPIPSWLFNLLLAPIGILGVNVLYWITGAEPVGSWAITAYGFVFIPLNLLAGGYLRQLAAHSMDQFSPALADSPKEFARLKYSFTIIPQRRALIITAIVALPLNVIWLYFLKFPIVYGLFSALGYSLGGCLFFQVARQLRMIGRLHALAKHVSLFDLDPLYAFSRLTARIGFLILLVVYLSTALALIIRPDNPELVYSNLAAIPFAVMCFILPLNGMHQRLAKEKTDLLAKINRQLETTLTELNRVIETGELERVDLLNRTTTSLINERDIVHKISTWPWQAATFRGFATTLLLPIFIWLITRLLTRFGI